MVNVVTHNVKLNIGFLNDGPEIRCITCGHLIQLEPLKVSPHDWLEMVKLFNENHQSPISKTYRDYLVAFDMGFVIHYFDALLLLLERQRKIDELNLVEFDILTKYG